jgi:hypothetical protein
VFTWKDKDAILVAGGGKLYVFDPASLASGPIATSASFGSADFDTGSLSSWTDAAGVRWTAAPGRTASSPKFVTRRHAVVPGGLTPPDTASPLPLSS